MAEECIDLKKNLGLSVCNKLPQMPRGMIETGMNFKFTPEQMATPELFQAALQDAIKAGKANRVYLWPFFANQEGANEDAVYEDTPLKVMAVRDGKYGWRFFIQESLCMHKAMFTHRTNKGRVFIYDNEDQLIGTKDSAGNFYGFTLALLHTEKLLMNDGSVATKSPIYVVLANNKELDLNGAVVDASFVNFVMRLTDVTIAVSGAFAAASFKVTVKATCDGTPIEGLALADFVMTNNAGAAQAIQTVVDEGDGVYTINAPGATPFVDGFLNLVAPADLSIDAYESTGPLTVNIP
jgi:hypothetical protein